MYLQSTLPIYCHQIQAHTAISLSPNLIPFYFDTVAYKPPVYSLTFTHIPSFKPASKHEIMVFSQAPTFPICQWLN